jgi:hypothetical protein
MVAGAPFFFGDGEGVTAGVSPASGVGVGLDQDVGDSSGFGVGEADDLCFFFGEGLGEDSGPGVGELFFFFFGEEAAVGSGASSGVGVTEAFFFFEAGDGDLCGVADGFGVGDLSGLSFFFAAVELLRCFRGAGVGLGAKIFLILLPNDSSAGARATTPTSIAINMTAPAIVLTRRMGAGK